MDQELYELVHLLNQLALASGAYDGSPLQARVRRALVAGETERHKGRLIELVPDVAYEYRCDSCHEHQDQGDHAMTDEPTTDTYEIELTQQYWLSIGKHKFALTTAELRSLWEQLNTFFGKEAAPAQVPRPPWPLWTHGDPTGGRHLQNPSVEKWPTLPDGSNDQWPPRSWQ